ncbi:hypothetical protein scyTo_0004181 [Scyliorhinus torazame]|uniref:Uncharacterized protein n=1 Tax=Scyliorhinus torazame TaxID=75743 RepID=A0A401NM89_SCYTO|nr:hypothetical protein [Scyliorhinus torazame]
MEELCIELLNRAELPRNPYMGFVRRLQQRSERFRLINSVPTERILSDLNFPTFSTAIGYISGPSIFTGTFYDIPPSVDILLIYVIIGPNYQRAISLYAECLRNDIMRMVQQQRHAVFRLLVPIDKNGQNKVFSKDEVMNQGEAFFTSVLAAVSEKQLIRLECLWRLNVAGSDFHRGAKLYSLSVVQASEAIGSERIFDFSEHPLIHLYSSVFLQRTHAEAYYQIFILREQATDKDLQQPRTRATYQYRGDGRASRDAVKSISPPPKVPLHGFQYAARGEDTPDASSILEPVRGSMMQRIARTSLITGAFNITYLSVLIILTELENAGNQEDGPQMTDTDQGLQEALVQLHRFLHGSGCQMWNILNLIETICKLLESDNIEYCVDCRLDWHWEQCLQGILSESPLPPNPYPIVASEFIKASLRMDLWQKRDEEIIHQSLQLTSQLVDCENHVSQVPGLEVFGLKSALHPLNPNTFQTVLGLITLMGIKDIPHRYQDFKVATGLGVNSSATWFGSLSPFLDVLELTEFYYLKGPSGCDREALQIYAQIVQRHLMELQQQLKGALMFTMWLSKSQRWSAHNILTYPSAFIEAFVESAANGNQTYLKVLHSSAGPSRQYFPIVKYFVLYYFEDQVESWLCFPQHNPIAIYQDVFLSKETAVFHRQRVGESLGGDTALSLSMG